MANRPKLKRNCILGIFSGVYRHCEDGVWGRSRVTMRIRCGRWDCDHCRKKKARKVHARAINGQIMKEAEKAGFRTYNVKLLTLTFGGREKRAGKTPEEAAREMSAACTRLIKELRHLYGYFHYLRVMETHEDGWPHFHILLCGQAIAPKEVLGTISRLWRFRYGYGFVKMNWAQTPKKALSYILKYLFKNPVQIAKTRMFSNSQGGLDPVHEKPKREWEENYIYWGESQETYRMFEELSEELGQEEYHVEVEIFPVKHCPF